MSGVSLDTSFLISFSDPKREHHQVAVNYFRHCVATRIPMFISTVVAGEFHVGQPFTDLPLQNFRIQPYNLPHALRAAELCKLLDSKSNAPRDDSRRIIINDLKIIAQATDEKIPMILSEDKGTLAKLAERAREWDNDTPRVLLLSEGFAPGRLTNPDQNELSL